MFVKHLRLDRFGSCSDARIEGLTAGLNVLCGTGRATVHFVRSMFFGFDALTRQGFLPTDPRGFGGAITVSTPAGLQTISRHDDGSVDGRLTVEHEDGSLIGRRHLQELLGGISAGTLERLFAVDFSQRPHVRELLYELEGVGIDLARDHDTARLQELRQALAEKRRELESIPEVSEALQELRIRRSQLCDEIGVSEQRLARGDAPAYDEHPEHEVTALRDEIQAEQQRLRSLTSALDKLAASKRDHLNSRRSASGSESTGDQQQQLESLDQQLARWQSVLGEIVHRKQSLQTISSGIPVSPVDDRGVRGHLRHLERQIGDLRAALDNVNHQRWQNPQLGSDCAAKLQQMQDTVYRICLELSHADCRAREAASSNELEQLTRCETELQSAIRNLSARRRQLLARRPHSDTVISQTEHAQRCRCDAHPSVQRAELQHSDAYDRRLDQLDTEITKVERKRENSIKKLDELEVELAELRTRFAALDRDTNRELAAQLQMQRAQLADVERELRQAQRRHEAAVAMAQLEQEIEQLEAVRDNSLLDEAGAYLRRLSGGDYDRFQIAGEAVVVHDGHAGRVNWTQLDEGARNQVYLSLCLAAVAQLRRRGIQLPVVLNAAFTHIESKDVPEAAEVIRDFALQGHQVLFCTRHEHVINVFRLLHTPILTVTSADPSDFIVRQQQDPREERDQTQSQAVDERQWNAEEFPGELTDRLRAGSLSSSETRLPPAGGTAAFQLNEACPIEDAPSLDAAHAVRFRKIGVWSIGDLIAVDADDAAEQLRYAGVTEEMVRSWQAQTRLVCRVPRLRPYDARILVACGITDPDQLKRMQPREVRDTLQRFAGSSHGQALLMSGTEFELSRVTDWINDDQEASAQHSDDDAGERSEATSRRTRRRHTRRSSGRDSATHSGESNPVLKIKHETSWKFFLDVNDAIVDAPSIGPRTAERLDGAGIHTAGDLLRADADQLAERLQHRRTNADTIRQWQQQTMLVCSIPQLRGHDAQILVALGVADPHQLAREDPQELWNKVAPFLSTNPGKRIIRNGKTPDLEEVSQWIRYAAAARTLNAA